MTPRSTSPRLHHRRLSGGVVVSAPFLNYRAKQSGGGTRLQFEVSGYTLD